MIRLFCLLWCVTWVVSIAIFLAIFDPEFDENENGIKPICDFCRDAFQSDDKEQEDRLWLAFWLTVGMIGWMLGRSIFRVLLGFNEVSNEDNL